LSIILAADGQRGAAKASITSNGSPGVLQPGLFQVPGSTATTLIWRPPAIG